jgi:hypothetical protein
MQYSNLKLLFECLRVFSFSLLQTSFFLYHTSTSIVFGMRQVILGFIDQFGALPAKVLALRFLFREQSSVLCV